MVVNEAAARKYWPGQDALGQRIKVGKDESVVVGVVGDIRHLGPETPPRQEGYVPMAQDGLLGGNLVARTTGDPMTVLPAVKAAIWSVNKDQRLTGDTFTLEGYMDQADRAAPVQHGAAGALRRAGPRDCGRRHLRRDGLRRRAAHQRDRRAHGARRDAARTSSAWC